MREAEESTEDMLETIMQEMRKLRRYYRSLMFCGIMISAVLIGAAYFTDPMWARISLVWLGMSISCGTLWIYLVAYREVRWKIQYYKSLYSIRRPKKKVHVIPVVRLLKKVAVNHYFIFF